jgi:hypothetical protein
MSQPAGPHTTRAQATFNAFRVRACVVTYSLGVGEELVAGAEQAHEVAGRATGRQDAVTALARRWPGEHSNTNRE